jgi:hypothetical protein
MGNCCLIKVPLDEPIEDFNDWIRHIGHNGGPREEVVVQAEIVQAEIVKHRLHKSDRVCGIDYVGNGPHNDVHTVHINQCTIVGL